MTPEQEKAFFADLERKYEWPKEPEETPLLEGKATILFQEDFEFILAALVCHIPASPERDTLVRVMCRSHRDLLALYYELRRIAESPYPPKQGDNQDGAN
jgi:hypothetical protein